MLELVYKKQSETLKIDQFWLRDHCQCSDCFNTETKQRRYNLLDLKPNVHALEVQYHDDDDDAVSIRWSDFHASKYSLSFLHAAQLPQMIKRRTNSTARMPWQQLLILQHEPQLRFTLPNLLAYNALDSVDQQDGVTALVRALVRYGIVFIDGVPPTTTMTELAIRRVFPVMKTFFGEMYTFSDRQDHADTAYTKQYLGSHTDNTYFCDAAGLQALHCIEHVNGTGGENFFVDGLHAARELKRREPQAFELLSTVQVPAEYIEDGQHHTHTAPIISVDPLTGEIVQLRFNLYDRAVFNTLAQSEMQKFYAAMRTFIDIVQDPANHWTLKLQPGTVVIFDNWRIFHGRHAYTGQRTMTGCYVQRTDFLSKARCLGIID